MGNFFHGKILFLSLYHNVGIFRFPSDLQQTHGAIDGNRTRDPVLTMDVLYQLSYNGIERFLARVECTRGPRVCQRGRLSILRVFAEDTGCQTIEGLRFFFPLQLHA